jgi:dTDP-4-amino-4,6-dideoxygalactose transaminase
MIEPKKGEVIVMDAKETNQDSGQATRREFLQTGGVAALMGLAMTACKPQPSGSGSRETLALSGGAKAVDYPDDKLQALTSWPRYGETERTSLHALIDKNTYYDELPAFEKEWKEYTGAPFVKTHMNGSSAITSMFFALSLDLPPGSEIMTPSYDFFSDALAQRFFGFVPTFIDIDPATACFDLEDAKKKLTKNTKVMFPMHAWGLPCEMDHILDFAKEKGLIVIEDAAHAHGASMQGKKMGTLGAMGIYSFQTTKVMPGVEGGMGMYQTREYFERAAAFGHYEDPVKFAPDSPVRAYEGTGFGMKLRMHPFAAALLRPQLKNLDAFNTLVETNVRRLNDPLVQLPGLSEPRIRPDQKRAYYSANMLLLDSTKAGFSREALLKALKAEGVHASVWDYPEQHKLKIYSEAKWWHHPPVIPTSMPGTDYVNKNHIRLPLMYGEASDVIEQYVKAFQKVWAHKSELS